MKIVTHSDETPVRLELHGKLIGKAAGAVHDAVETVVAKGGQHIELDLHALAVVDSAGLEALLACHERCAAAGGRCTLTGVSGKIERILRITRLDRELEFVPG
ncbi:MAG: STAS domain-containing protein [Phycisphaerales bacterium]|nr:STAS domain-containing protein [Phycisphaerales bacterium]